MGNCSTDEMKTSTKFVKLIRNCKRTRAYVEKTSMHNMEFARFFKNQLSSFSILIISLVILEKKKMKFSVDSQFVNITYKLLEPRNDDLL